MTERFLASVSGAQLGFIVNNVPGAVAGYKYAGKMYDYVHKKHQPIKKYPKKKQNMAPIYVRTGSKFSKGKRVSSGFYDGKIPAGKQPDKGYKQSILKTGYAAKLENFGRVTDPTGMWLYHGTFAVNQMTTAIVGAIIRKGFKVAGIDIDNINAENQGLTSTNSAGYLLRYSTKKVINAGSETSLDFLTADDQSLKDFITGFANMGAHIRDYLLGVSTELPWEFAVHHVIDPIAPGPLRTLPISVINLFNAKISVYIESTLHFQNRTSGDVAVAGNNDADRVDNQPVACTSYKFNNVDPRLKGPRQNNSTNNQIGSGATGGFKSIRSAQFSSTAFLDRPSSHIWSNCSKTSSFVVQPGQMKKSTVSYTLSGGFQNVTKNLRVGDASLGNNLLTGTRGRSEFLVFEEKLRTAGTNLITIAYEHSYEVGCSISPKMGGHVQVDITSIDEANNIAP